MAVAADARVCDGFASRASAEPALIEAVSRGDVTAVRSLLRSGSNTEDRDARGRTALMIATHLDNVELARLLIEGGADVNAKDAIKDTPYLYAAAEGRTEILKLALKAGANLKDTNRYGGTGLIPAADRGRPDVIRVLLATEIDVDHINNLGWTALLEAVMLGDGGPVYQEIVKLLIESGASKDIADRDGVTPLEHARRRGYKEIERCSTRRTRRSGEPSIFRNHPKQSG